mgnify:CR=1 FL=1
MHQFGVFQDPAVLASAESHNRLAIDASQLARFWHRCGMTSDFWARYGSLFVPTAPRSGFLSRESAFHVFSYLLNELFENCAKFSGGPVSAVGFDSWMFADQVVYQISNHIRPEGVQGFTELIQELLQGDLEELYFRKLEANAESGQGGSGLGYLTLMKDYGIKFGFGFEALGDESVRVDVQALVSKKG